MAVTRQIFILFLGAVLVKSHHLHHLHSPHHNHHQHHHHQHNDLPNFFDDSLYPGIFGVGLFGSNIFGNGGSQPDGYIAPVDNYDGDTELGENYTPLTGGNDVGVNVPGQNNVNIEQPNEPDVPLNIPVPKEPLTLDIQGLNSHANEVPVNNINVNIPANTNGQSNEPQSDPNLTNHVDINESQANLVPDNAEGPKINDDAGPNTTAGDHDLSGSTQQTNPKEKNGDLIVDNVPGFLDDDIKKGIVLAGPELKYNINEPHEPKSLDEVEGHHSNVDAVQGLDSKNKPEEKNDNSIGNKETELRVNDNNSKGTELKNNDTNLGLDKYSDSVVFPDDVDEAKNQNQANTSDVQQNLPNRFSAGDSDKKYSSVASGVASTIAPSNYIPSQLITSNNNAQTFPTSNNQGTQNQYTSQPYSVVFVAKPNQQMPVNNGNGSPPVNVVRNPNGGYTVVNVPNNNGKPGQIYESVTSNGNSAVNNPGQLFVSVNSEINSPSQGYISGNSGVSKPSQIYVPVNGNSGANNAGQTYVIADGTNSGVTNPGQTYVIANGANSGVDNPGQTFVLANGANSGVNNPGQTYVLANGANSGVNNGQTYVLANGANSGVNNPGQVYASGNSGINNPSQIYVPVNSGGNNPGSTYVPSPTSQTMKGAYYNVIELSNGQTVLVPANNGNGQNAQWNGQSNNGQIYVPVNYNPGQGNNPTGSIVHLANSGNSVTGGATNNVPLLISYKDKDGKDKEESVKKDQLKEGKE